MGILSGILGGGIEKTAQPIEAVFNGLDKLFTSKDEKLNREEIRMRIAQKPDIMTQELNKIEAQHRTIFVAGWRPFIGWVCGLALLYNYIMRDLISWILAYVAPEMAAPPALAMEHLLTILGGMLGMGALRSIEKVRGKAK